MAEFDSSGSLSAAPSGALQHDAKSNAVHRIAKRIARQFPTVPLTSSTQLKRSLDEPMLRKSIAVVDVRQAEEMDVSTIPSSITAEEFEARKDELSGKTIVCFCTIGYRSSAYAAKLLQQGIEAKNLEGGIVRWSQKHYPLVKRTVENGSVVEREVKRVHVYGKDWALQPDDVEAVMFKSPILATLRSVLPRWLGGK